jgi:hypothetical protein
MPPAVVGVSKASAADYYGCAGWNRFYTQLALTTTVPALV